MARLSDFQFVVNAWLDIDGRLQGEQNTAQAKKRGRVAAKLGRLRTENDRAYFLLIFARFEAYLTSKAEVLIARRQASPSWTTRRGWDVLDTNNMSRIWFMNRLSYCLDRRSADYTTVKNLYTIRNALAHKGTTATPFIIPIVAQQLSTIAGRLKT